jgi:NAD(P)-dependent dehydrogenase (short-subunit alcohol dehydrogenase family)
MQGKVAVVTGGSRGIGRAIATRFAAEGASVMIASRNENSLRTTASEIAGEVSWTVANAGDPEAAEACLAGTVARYGGVDILVNNAATNPYFGPTVDIDPARAVKTMTVNTLGPLSWIQAAWRAGMCEAGGCVVNIASIGGFTVEPNIGFYNVTKAALIHLTAQLASELGPRVRVNAVAPGLVKTEMARALWEPIETAFSTTLPMRRLGEVYDIASAAFFLASDEAGWITGHTLVVDGGATVSGAVESMKDRLDS